jgi:hypothetical protein
MKEDRKRVIDAKITFKVSGDLSYFLEIGANAILKRSLMAALDIDNDQSVQISVQAGSVVATATVSGAKTEKVVEMQSKFDTGRFDPLPGTNLTAEAMQVDQAPMSFKWKFLYLGAMSIDLIILLWGIVCWLQSQKERKKLKHSSFHPPQVLSTLVIVSLLAHICYLILKGTGTLARSTIAAIATAAGCFMIVELCENWAFTLMIFMWAAAAANDAKQFSQGKWKRIALTANTVQFVVLVAAWACLIFSGKGMGSYSWISIVSTMITTAPTVLLAIGVVVYGDRVFKRLQQSTVNKASQELAQSAIYYTLIFAGLFLSKGLLQIIKTFRPTILYDTDHESMVLAISAAGAIITWVSYSLVLYRMCDRLGWTHNAVQQLKEKVHHCTSTDTKDEPKDTDRSSQGYSRRVDKQGICTEEYLNADTSTYETKQSAVC